MKAGPRWWKRRVRPAVEAARTRHPSAGDPWTVSGWDFEMAGGDVDRAVGRCRECGAVVRPEVVEDRDAYVRLGTGTLIDPGRGMWPVEKGAVGWALWRLLVHQGECPVRPR